MTVMKQMKCAKFISGSSGNEISIISNMFRLERAPNFHLFQYRVDFNPEVPSKGMRKSMLKEHIDLIGPIYQFDGMTLFLPILLEREVMCSSLAFILSKICFFSSFWPIVQYIWSKLRCS